MRCPVLGHSVHPCTPRSHIACCKLPDAELASCTVLGMTVMIFPPCVAGSLPACRTPEAELASRRDLRSPDYLICSIDPPGCTDVDDALSVRWLGPSPSGGGRELMEVGVHIADVSFFVRQVGRQVLFACLT